MHSNVVEGYLDCFKFLAVNYNATMNIYVPVGLYMYRFMLHVYLEVTLLCHRECRYTTKQIWKNDYPNSCIILPTQKQHMKIFILHMCPTLKIVHLLKFNHTGCETAQFHLYNLNKMLLVTLAILFCEMPVQILLLIFRVGKGVLSVSPLLIRVSSFYIFWILVLYIKQLQFLRSFIILYLDK